MKKYLFCIVLCLAGMSVYAQPDLEKMRETLRFVRLAESKNNLDFDDETLLKVNEIMDSFEERRFALLAREREIRQRASEELTDEEADRMLDDLVDVRKAMADNDLSLWTDIRAELNGRDSVKFFTFYERFSRDVQRRIRAMQQRRGDAEGRFGRGGKRGPGKKGLQGGGGRRQRNQ